MYSKSLQSITFCRTPGCPWTADHEAPAAELHLVLALMSSGPVGISDSIGHTNITLAKRAIRSDGVLLKPMKAITAVDSTFLKKPASHYLYSTFGLGPSWIYVSFFSEENAVSVTKRDFWPKLDPGSDSLVYRHFHSSSACVHNKDAATSSCVAGLVSRSGLGNSDLMIPMGSQGDHSPYAPAITYVWQNCVESKWFLLGELSKYVPLSPARFQSLSCTATGISTKVLGEPGEVVELTALKPRSDGSFRIVVAHIRIPRGGDIQVNFETFLSDTS